MEERIQKIIAARHGISRRAAEKLIACGAVTVNNSVAHLGDKADPLTDILCINGIRVSEGTDKKIYIALNKPVGYVTTMSDDRGRKTVAELVEDIPERVYPVGRLDINSEGLLLMTNDGEFANAVMHPSFQKDKTYRVTVCGPLENGIARLNAPMKLDGREISKPKVSLVRETLNGGILDIVIHEGRYRQVRRMCAQAGLKVVKLTRTSIGPVKLGRLKSGTWRKLSNEEIQKLRKS